jgi:hypothetical protein
MQVRRGNNDYAEAMSLAFLTNSFRVINVEVDAKRRWKLGGSLPSNDQLMPVLIHNPVQRDSEAAKPAT